MEPEALKELGNDANGLMTYEYIANHIDSITVDDLNQLVDNMIHCDHSGQFIVSTARYLHAIDAAKFAEHIDRLIKAEDEDFRLRFIQSGIMKTPELSVFSRINFTSNTIHVSFLTPLCGRFARYGWLFQFMIHLRSTHHKYLHIPLPPSRSAVPRSHR